MEYWDDDGDFPTRRTVFLIVGIISSIMGVLFVLCNVHDFILATFAPRLYLIQYISELIKSVK